MPDTNLLPPVYASNHEINRKSLNHPAEGFLNITSQKSNLKQPKIESLSLDLSGIKRKRKGRISYRIIGEDDHNFICGRPNHFSTETKSNLAGKSVTDLKTAEKEFAISDIFVPTKTNKHARNLDLGNGRRSLSMLEIPREISSSDQNQVHKSSATSNPKNIKKNIINLNQSIEFGIPDVNNSLYLSGTTAKRGFKRLKSILKRKEKNYTNNIIQRNKQRVSQHNRKEEFIYNSIIY